MARAGNDGKGRVEGVEEGGKARGVSEMRAVIGNAAHALQLVIVGEGRYLLGCRDGHPDPG